MPAKVLIDKVYFWTKLCHNILHVLPFTFITQRSVTIVSKSKIRNQVFWSLIFILNIFSTVLQIADEILQTEKTNLTVVLFHGLLLLVACGTFAAFITYNWQACEICGILNCLIARPNGLHTTLFRYQGKSSKFLISLFVMITPLIFILLAIVEPIVTLTCPCLYENQLYTLLLGPCNTYSFRLVVFMLSILFSLPIGSLLSFLAIFCGVTLMEINDSLKKFQSILKILLTFKDPLNRNNLLFKLSLVYRQLQIFVIICNDCYQRLFWPAFEFLGAMEIMALMYALIMFSEVFSVLSIAILITCLIMTTCFYCIVLDMGSQSRLISGRILAVAQTNLKSEIRTRKCFKSCKPIALKVGSFHEMDRQRFPNVMRFILQRTIFLVLKTKQGGFVGNVMISIPS